MTCGWRQVICPRHAVGVESTPGDWLSSSAFRGPGRWGSGSTWDHPRVLDLQDLRIFKGYIYIYIYWLFSTQKLGGKNSGRWAVVKHVTTILSDSSSAGVCCQLILSKRDCLLLLRSVDYGSRYSIWTIGIPTFRKIEEPQIIQATIDQSTFSWGEPLILEVPMWREPHFTPLPSSSQVMPEHLASKPVAPCCFGCFRRIQLDCEIRPWKWRGRKNT